VAEVVRYAFDELRLDRVQAWVFANNTASKRLLHKLGFTHEGTMRARVRWGAGRVDDEVFGLLRDEWLSRGS
jgi:RimJ/RimL family protein N-acetyltransferase